ncbi:MAG: ribose 5-phosphate isomerase B [Oscillospiraceae bacterium]|nr:ribose 5-phosphate isomerase B [Oscillospiraceae bacterium]
MIALGSDHAGLELKKAVMDYLDEKGLEYRDYGTFTPDSCDYPVYAAAAARAVAAGECDRGILICGTGAGMAISANKIAGIRCACCSDCFTAEMVRLHNDANMLSMGQRVVGTGLALKILETFLTTPFEGGRHARRVGLIHELEKQ